VHSAPSREHVGLRPELQRPALAARLRDETRGSHRIVEQRLGLPGSLRSPADLVALLELWQQVWIAAGHSADRLPCVPGAELVGEVALSLQLIADDLGALPESGHPAVPTDEPRLLFALPLAGGEEPESALSDVEATALGVLYVLRGSRLGARFVAGPVANRCGVTGQRGARFLLSDGDDVRGSWRQFLDRLEAWSQAHGGREHDAVVAAAGATFAAVDALAAAAGWNGDPPPHLVAPRARDASWESR
jgi:heme oxygenase